MVNAADISIRVPSLNIVRALNFAESQRAHVSYKWLVR